jgi:hypothetical protein
MAKISLGTLKEFINGQTVQGPDFNTFLEILRVAINDNDDKILQRYTKTENDNQLNGKADKATTYTKTEVDSSLDLKADKSNTYTKSEVDTSLDLKSDKESTYTKAEVYNKQELFTQDETINFLDMKADKTDVYTKEEVYPKETVYTKDDVYTKGETFSLLSVQNTEFLDGGSFLDKYTSQTGGIDGGTF